MNAKNPLHIFAYRAHAHSYGSVITGYRYSAVDSQEIITSRHLKVSRKFFLKHNKSFRWHLGDYEKHNLFPFEGPVLQYTKQSTAIIDGNSEISAHVRSNLCYFICLRHSIRSKRPIFLHACAICSELQSNTSTMDMCARVR